jgi:hypothetical protein
MECGKFIVGHLKVWDSCLQWWRRDVRDSHTSHESGRVMGEQARVTGQAVAIEEVSAKDQYEAKLA